MECSKDALILTDSDLLSMYNNKTKKINIFNISKKEINLVIKALEDSLKNRPDDKSIIRMLKKYRGYLNTFK